MSTTVTYSPQDDKLRVYFATRQSDETLAPLRAAGFHWAGMQECWFAVWTPAREDAALAMPDVDGIDDEPSTLEERAEARAERFDGYASNAAKESEQRYSASRAAVEMIPFGQPILVGHHSEGRHRRAIERSNTNMRASIEADKRASYWSGRSGASVRWASYKENPSGRARRIGTLQADWRKCERTRVKFTTTRGEFVHGAPLRKLVMLANYSSSTGVSYGTYDALEKVVLLDPVAQAETLHKIIDGVQASAAAQIDNANRWLAHLAGRIAYETDQLKAQGCGAMLEPKPRRVGKAALPLLNLREGAHAMTAAEFAEIHNDYKGTRVVDKAYRVRTAMVRSQGMSLCVVFLSDKKEHSKPVAAPVGGAS